MREHAWSRPRLYASLLQQLDVAYPATTIEKEMIRTTTSAAALNVLLHDLKSCLELLYIPVRYDLYSYLISLGSRFRLVSRASRTYQTSTCHQTSAFSVITRDFHIDSTRQDTSCVNSVADSVSRVSESLAEDPSLDLQYDYLENVKSLCDKIGPDMYDSMFEQHFQQSQANLFWVHESTMNFSDPGPESDDGWKPANIYETLELNMRLNANDHELEDTELRTLRHSILSANRENPCVLIVEDIDKFGVELLGKTLNVDPCFFAQHFGSSELRYERPGRQDMDTLRKNFRNFVERQHAATNHATTGHYTGLHSNPSYKVDGVVRIKTDPSALLYVWPLAPTGRIDIGGANTFLTVRTSCYRASQYGYPSLPLIVAAHSPFSTDHMLSFGLKRLPVQLGHGAGHYAVAGMLFAALGKGATALATRRHLFGTSSDISAQAATAIMPLLIILSAWESNVRYLEERLSISRHEAIVSPSLTTFHPLTLLRRNIADVEAALLANKARIHSNDEDLMKSLRRNTGSELESLDPLYETLLTRVKIMSTTLNNEIQLVIDSVTVQDSAIMKQQARRATLLTILAAIYLPLTLVTGIFGINIKEIDDGAPRFWARIAGLFVIGGATAAGFFGYWYWCRGHEAREAEERRREDKVYKLA